MYIVYTICANTMKEVNSEWVMVAVEVEQTLAELEVFLPRKNEFHYSKNTRTAWIKKLKV